MPEHRRMDNGGQGLTGKLAMVRHGESHGNFGHRLEPRFCGTHLTDHGATQAARFGTAVVGSPRLIRSVALRARQTAEQIKSVVGIRSPGWRVYTRYRRATSRV
ncbi:histidine phosphatase family protein [Nocardia sp. Root136]|uniref:histidine phosphatase family protein n=1 Tax=Nocardia sp. Root136 TaxID=1736458 RepID=UPI000A00E0EF